MVHLDLDPNFFQDNERTVGKHLSSHLRLFWVIWNEYLSRDIDDQWILQSDWGRSTTGHTQPKVVVSNAALTSWLSPCKKSMISLNCFLIHWWWKNTAIVLKKKHDWPHRTLSGSTRYYLYAKCLWDCWIFSRDIDDQQSDWIRDLTGCTQPKLVVWDATSLWWLSPFNKPKRLIDSFQRYWWSKDNAIWLAENTVGHNWTDFS